MSDHEDYFYSPADDYYSDNDQSYLYSPQPGSLSHIIRNPPAPPQKSPSQADEQLQIPPWRREPSTNSTATDEKNETQPVKVVEESPNPAAIMSESVDKEEDKEGNQAKTKFEGKRVMDDVESEALPAQKKAKTI